MGRGRLERFTFMDGSPCNQRVPASAARETASERAVVDPEGTNLAGRGRGSGGKAGRAIGPAELERSLPDDSVRDLVHVPRADRGFLDEHGLEPRDHVEDALDGAALTNVANHVIDVEA